MAFVRRRVEDGERIVDCVNRMLPTRERVEVLGAVRSARLIEA